MNKITLIIALFFFVIMFLYFLSKPYREKAIIEEDKIAKAAIESSYNKIKMGIMVYNTKYKGKKWPRTKKQILKSIGLEEIPEDYIKKNNAFMIKKGKPKGLDLETPPFITGGGGWVYFPATGDLFVNLKGVASIGGPRWGYGR